MRILLSGIIFLLVCLVGISALAQNPLVLYDDFNSAFIDIEKWTSSDSRGMGVTLLETVRELHGNRLLLVARAFGNTVPISTPPTPVPNFGTRPGDVNSGFGVTEVFQSMKVSVKVSQAQATGCPDFNATPTAARARLLGFYFNAGEISPLPDPPTSPGRLNDVLVQIRIQRRSDSTDKPQILEVWVDVVRCTDTGCGNASNDGLSPVHLGNINLGQWATIQIDWDSVRYFNIKLDKEPAVVIDVLGPKNPGAPVWSVNPVSSPWNALGVSNRLAANCPTDERAMGYVEAEFDNLFVRSFP